MPFDESRLVAHQRRDRPINRFGAIGAALLVASVAAARDGEDVRVQADPDSGDGAAAVQPTTAVFDATPYLLGGWNGFRSDLAPRGVRWELDWTQHAMGVIDGGLEEEFRYGGSVDLALSFDLGAMDLLPGGYLAVRGESRYGESVNGDTGALLPASTDLFFPLTAEPDDNIALAVTEVLYTQFLSESFALYGGKLQTLDGDPNEFAAGRGRSRFMNASFVFNPVTALTVPYSTLGAGALWIASPRVTVTSTVMNTTDASRTTGFGDIGDGWTWSTEVQLQHRLGRLPGGGNLGLIIAGDNDFVSLVRLGSLQPGNVLAREDETWAAYASGWQYLWTAEPAPDRIAVNDRGPDVRGFGLFGRFGIADSDTNPIEWTASGGLGGRGLLAARPDDGWGVGVAYAELDLGLLSGASSLEAETWAIEAFYEFALGRGVGLTLDVQHIDGIFATVDAATLLGARLNVRF